MYASKRVRVAPRIPEAGRFSRQQLASNSRFEIVCLTPTAAVREIP